MKVRVASIGRDRAGLFAPAVAEYQKRLSRYAGFSLVELPESRRAGAQALEEEARALLKLASPRDWLVALDERGQQLSSVELSRFLARAQSESRDLLFAVGGDEGLSSEVRQRAKLVLSLSRMTLPHRLARLVLLEQLYRAFTILRGEPYHK
ncbi:MAG: 23S rRNA (pseudouridine(1915)-N(3))-methyltransferase RlmH [Myxococcales bacterium]|nr:23S rRNA (pseudouridine(1915)-N(3))-methyltransferase RlmH [Myxococcales bacterium]